MARKDPDFDGNYTRYIEFLKVMVADPAQQKLIRERDIETEAELTLPAEKVEKRKQAFKSHILTKKETKQKHNLTKTTYVHKSDEKNIKKQLGI